MAAITPTAGGSLNLTPSPQKQTLSGNYLDFAGTTDTTWAQQYLPELIEQEAEIFGNRSISGFLSQVGAEESMASDQVVWSEQGRLHLSYKGTLATDTSVVTITHDIDGNALTTTHGVRLNDQVIVATDCEEIKSVVNSFSFSKVEVYNRKAENAQDTSSTESVILEYLSEKNISSNTYFILTQLTSPFTTAVDFNTGLNLMETHDSVLSVVRSKRFFWSDSGQPINYDFQKRPRRREFLKKFMKRGIIKNPPL